MVTALCVLLAVLLVIAAALNLQRPAISLGFCLLLVFAARLTSFSGFTQNGIAEVMPEITTFGVAVLVFAVMALRYPDRARLPLALWLFIGYLAIGMMFFWTRTWIQWSGVEQYLLAPLGFVAGTFVGEFSRRNRVNACWLAATVTTAMLLQVAVSLVQLTGVHFLSRFGDGVENLTRTAGSTGNPNVLGTFGLFSLLILLPLTRHEWRRVNVTAMVGVVACVAVQALCDSRATFIATLLALFAWVVLTPGGVREGFGRRGYLVVSAAATLVAAVRLTSRFTQDPVGQERQVLLGRAFSRASDYLLTGMGPNNYLTYLYGDDFVAFPTVQPVHNAFILAAAELGVLGCLLLMLPWLLTTIGAGRRLLQGTADLSARLILAAFLPIALIAMVDKAILAAGLPLFFLLIGICQPAGTSGPARWVRRWLRKPAGATDPVVRQELPQR